MHDPPSVLLCAYCHVTHSLYALGKLQEAAARCAQLEHEQPKHTENLLLFASIHFALARFDLALDYNLRAGADDESAPTKLAFAMLYAGVGSKLFLESDRYRAEQAFRNALAIDKTLANVHNDLGNVLKTQGHAAPAKIAYMEALRLQPSLAVAWNNLACVNLDEGEHAQALQHLCKAIFYDPHLDCAYSNLTFLLGLEEIAAQLTLLAESLRDANSDQYAEYVYRKALATCETAAAHSGLGIILHRAQRLQEAVVHYSAALRINCCLHECHTNLGLALRDLGDLNGARTSFLNCVKLTPTADDFNYLACICKDLGNNIEAIEYFQNSLHLNGENYHVFCNLVHSLQMICDWSEYDQRMQQLVTIVDFQLKTSQFPSVHPHHSFLYPLDNPTRRAIASAHAQLALEQAKARNKHYTFDHLFPLGPNDRIRIGYVSSDFKDHPTAHLMQSVPGFHNRSVVEVFLYSLAADDGSAYRAKLVAESEHFVDVSGVTDFAAIADQIYMDGIHILINLNGYTKGARTEVFALKPAPIQAMWLGFPGTSGASYMDYIITDKITSPLERCNEQYSEKLVHMPHTFFVGDHMQMFPLPALSEQLAAADSLTPSMVELPLSTPHLPSSLVAFPMSPAGVAPLSLPAYNLASSLPNYFHQLRAQPSNLFRASPSMPLFFPFAQPTEHHPVILYPYHGMALPGQQGASSVTFAQQSSLLPFGGAVQSSAEQFAGSMPLRRVHSLSDAQKDASVAGRLRLASTQMLVGMDAYQQQAAQLMPLSTFGDHQQAMMPSGPHLVTISQQYLHSLGITPGLGVSQSAQSMLLTVPKTHLLSFSSHGATRPDAPILLPKLQQRRPPSHAPLPGLPGTLQPPQPPLLRSSYDLPEDVVLFCNFNQLYKIDPVVFKTWIAILKRAPNSALWLLRFPPAGEANLRRIAESEGLPAHQLIFTPVAHKIEHVRRGALADICLDTKTCNGHTTGMDILWAGTPLLTLPGDTLASRVASSLVSALGCPELIASSLQEYEDMAVDLATNISKLRAVQAKVRQNRMTHPLFNTRMLVSSLELAYTAMVQQHMAGSEPAHIDLSTVAIAQQQQPHQQLDEATEQRARASMFGAMTLTSGKDHVQFQQCRAHTDLAASAVIPVDS